MPQTCGAADVLVLGGGLAGAAAAIMLARAGARVTLVERETAPRHKVCGEFLSGEALDFLALLGISLDQPQPPAIDTVRLVSSHHVAEAKLPFPARSLTRRCLDGLLLDAAAQAGATVLRGTTVESLTPASRGGWLATLNTGDTLTAPRTILASGKHDLRGYPRPHGPQGDLVAMKMYFRLSAAETRGLAGAVELLLHPHGYTGLQLVENGVANLCGLVQRSHLAKLGGWGGLLAELQRSNPHARQRLGGAQPLLDKPLALSAIPYGFVRRDAVGAELYAVGDQAAVIPSFTGDGMSLALYTGISAARAVLAEQPAAAFQRRLHRQLRGQVLRATVLSRALVYRPTRDVLTLAAHLWPGGLRLAATTTRLAPRAVKTAAPTFTARRRVDPA